MDLVSKKLSASTGLLSPCNKLLSRVERNSHELYLGTVLYKMKRKEEKKREEETRMVLNSRLRKIPILAILKILTLTKLTMILSDLPGRSQPTSTVRGSY